MESTMCNVCGCIGMISGGDGFYYCRVCATQSQDLIEQPMENEEMVYQGIYNTSFRRKMQAPVQSQDEIDKQAQVEMFTKMQRINMTGEQRCSQPANVNDSDDDVPLRDFGSQHNSAVLDYETLSSQIRERYLEGMQIMIEMQCESLVENFGVSPLICGLAGPIWLHLVASSHVLRKTWATEALQAADALYEDHRRKDEGFDDKNLSTSRYQESTKFKSEPRSSLYGQKARIIWVRSLKDRIPLATSLAVSFLACHIAREVILPTDMIKWALEGRLPYLAAFVEIEKMLGADSKPWPMSSKFLLRPSRVLGPRQLELMSGCLAKHIGLELPPINFHSMSRRFLKQLGLPEDKLLPALSHMHEWSVHPGLWLSADASDFPTRVYAMSMLVVIVRIIYDIHGQGYLEKSISANDKVASGSTNEACSQELSKDQLDRPCKLDASCVNNENTEYNSLSINQIAKSEGEFPNSTCFQDQELDATTMLQNLQSWHQDNTDKFDYGKDLQSYLQYCKDVIFAGSKMSYDEEALVRHFWQLYEKLEKQDLDPAQELEGDAFLGLSVNDWRQGNASNGMDVDNGSLCQRERNEFLGRGLVKQETETTFEDTVVRGPSEFKDTGDKGMKLIISDMEQNGFHYMPPEQSLPSNCYLSYRKKNTFGKSHSYVHADYYILLRACARAVKVNAYVLHRCVLKIEKRLTWIEDHIARILQEKV